MLIRLVLAAVAAIVAFSGPAPAFVGDVDQRNVHSATVLLSSGGGSCTGVVLRPSLVITAAHCVWEKGAYKGDVRIHYVDPSNTKRTVAARSMTVPKAFKDIDPMARLGDDGNTTFNDVLTQSQRAVVYSRAIAEDIAVLVPSEPIQVAEQVRTLLDDDLPLAVKVRGKRWSTSVGNEVKQAFDGLFRAGGRKPALRAVGYGNYTCTDYANRLSCKSDGQRRFGDVEDAEDWFRDAGDDRMVMLIGGGTGGALTESKFTPLRKGDSGGPVFIRHPTDGSWRLAGVHSRANARFANWASLLYHTDFIEAALRGSGTAEHVASTRGIALAAGLFDGNVRIGYSIQDTPEKAEADALARCRSNRVTCKVVRTIRSGCAFITWGENNKRIGWNFAASAEEALRDCQGKGYTCAKPMGGCL